MWMNSAKIKKKTNIKRKCCLAFWETIVCVDRFLLTLFGLSSPWLLYLSVVANNIISPRPYNFIYISLNSLSNKRPQLQGNRKDTCSGCGGLALYAHARVYACPRGECLCCEFQNVWRFSICRQFSKACKNKNPIQPSCPLNLVSRSTPPEAPSELYN